MNIPLHQPRKWIYVALGLAALIPQICALPASALPEMPELVPRRSANGDFTTSMVLGGRGNYQAQNWVVTDSTPLNCRYTRMAPGMIIYPVFRDGRPPLSPRNEAIVINEGVPWLRVSGTRQEIRFEGGGDLGECYVRANIKYIAPVSTYARLK
jgi:hypothetical protein